MTTEWFSAFAPGRVNLIGDHTDYAGGLALPCAIDLGITFRGQRVGTTIALTSDTHNGSVTVDMNHLQSVPSMTFESSEFPTEPEWVRYVAAVAYECRATTGLFGTLQSTVPSGAGLSSSAALEILLALALGFEGSPLELAMLGQRAELRAVGVPCGLLDQLSIVFGKANQAMVIDFSDLSIEQVAFPENLDIVILHSGETRQLATSQYAERRAACEIAAERIGPLAVVSIKEIESLDEPLFRRARHVVTECNRVRQAAVALRENNPAEIGRLMTQSHTSLRDDFEVSTSTLDALVDRLVSLPGVYGARLTGAGFGGCVVALCEGGAIKDPAAMTGQGWIVRPADGARILTEKSDDNQNHRY
ncbi:MAG: galactokinase family protein [Acidimicrobiales bacterium]